MDYAALRDCKPDLFYAAAGDWTGWRDGLEDQQLGFDNDVLAPMNDPAIWSGAGAAAATIYSDSIARGLRHATDETARPAEALTSLADVLTSCQGRLLDITARARAQGFVVDDRGTITVPPGIEIPVGTSAELLQGEVEMLTAELHDAVYDATMADLRARAELDSFSGQTTEATAVAAGDRAQEALADEAAALAAVDDPSDEQLAQLNTLLERNSDDPTFAARFVDQLGARGLLDLSENIADLAGAPGRGQRDTADNAALADLQQHLGETLATATDPGRHPNLVADSPGEQPDFTDELIDAARQEYDDGTRSGAQPPLGYHYLGPLLHHGDYSSDFLNRVGDDMLRLEERDPGIWQDRAPSEGLGGELLNPDRALGVGTDPMSGLMDALSRNPDAAVDFFHPDGDDNPLRDQPPRLSDERVAHMLDRDWTTGPEYGGAPQLGPDLLGNALEAGALHEPRDGRAAAIAYDTVNHLGNTALANPDQQSGELAIGMHPDMRDSVGRILEGYIADVNEAMRPGSDGPGLTNDGKFDDWALNRTLQDVARDPDAYAGLREQQLVYTAVEMNSAAGINAVDALNGIASRSSLVLGALDLGRTDAIHADRSVTDHEYNEALERRGRIANYALGSAVGGAAAMTTGPFAPVAAGVGGEVVKGAVAEVITDAVDAARQDTSAQSNTTAAQVGQENVDALADLTEQALWDNGAIPRGTGFPDSLYDLNGQPIPLGLMSPEQWSQYRSAIDEGDTSYETQIGKTVSRAADGYTNGIGIAETARGRR